jgi:hypothetical protein
MIADSGYSHEMRRFVCFVFLKNLFQMYFLNIKMMKVIVVFLAFISEWEIRIYTLRVTSHSNI